MDAKFHPAMAAIKNGDLDKLKTLVKSGFFPGNVMFSEKSSHSVAVFWRSTPLTCRTKLKWRRSSLTPVRKSTGPSWPRPA